MVSSFNTYNWLTAVVDLPEILFCVVKPTNATKCNVYTHCKGNKKSKYNINTRAGGELLVLPCERTNRWILDAWRCKVRDLVKIAISLLNENQFYLTTSFAGDERLEMERKHRLEIMVDFKDTRLRRRLQLERKEPRDRSLTLQPSWRRK